MILISRAIFVKDGGINMGLGPSIKMTTLHHYNCPLIECATADKDIEVVGVVVSGVSESFDEKIYVAQRVGDIAKILQVEGALIAIDGWGNHHIDFVSTIEELGKNNIVNVGLSFIGLQGRLVCTNPYVDSIIDLNKGVFGYETCVVGENNLTKDDAIKAIAILKSKLKRKNTIKQEKSKKEITRELVKKIYNIENVIFGEKTELNGNTLIIRKNIEDTFISFDKIIKKITLNIIKPQGHNVKVNSNLDFMPISCKEKGELGEGVTRELSGVKVMLTGLEEESGYQPANIGSSEGILKEQVKFNMAGTPKEDDFIIHLDFLFSNGKARSAEGITTAHRLADLIIQEIREAVIKVESNDYKEVKFEEKINTSKTKILIVKIVSGLGNMYDTILFPNEPAGVLGGKQIRNCGNIPHLVSVNQCRDGIIHSLI